jgi:hypothetical protein
MEQFRAPVWQNNLKRMTEFRLTLALLSRFINWLKRVYPVRSAMSITQRVAIKKRGQNDRVLA